jgi:hypothetical protein
MVAFTCTLISGVATSAFTGLTYFFGCSFAVFLVSSFFGASFLGTSFLGASFFTYYFLGASFFEVSFLGASFTG